MVIKNVWYRSTPGSVIEDRGRAVFDGDTFTFRSPKQEVGGQVVSAARRPVGVRSWIEVRYRDDNDEVRAAYLLVKDLFGWMGILGGNDQLLAAAVAAGVASGAGGDDPDATEEGEG